MDGTFLYGQDDDRREPNRDVFVFAWYIYARKRDNFNANRNDNYTER